MPQNISSPHIISPYSIKMETNMRRKFLITWDIFQGLEKFQENTEELLLLQTKTLYRRRISENTYWTYITYFLTFNYTISVLNVASRMPKDFWLSRNISKMSICIYVFLPKVFCAILQLQKPCNSLFPSKFWICNKFYKGNHTITVEKSI